MTPQEQGAAEMPPLPNLLRRADWHYRGEGVREAIHAYARTYAAQQVAAERERCARLVETQETYGDPVQGWFDILAAAIRKEPTA